MGIVFWVGYLLGFLRLESQPVYDPGGHLEPLNSGDLVHTSLMMTALALLCAFIGASVGLAFAEVLLTPLYQVAHLTWQHFVPKHESAAVDKEAAPPVAPKRKELHR